MVDTFSMVIVGKLMAGYEASSTHQSPTNRLPGVAAVAKKKVKKKKNNSSCKCDGQK